MKEKIYHGIAFIVRKMVKVTGVSQKQAPLYFHWVREMMMIMMITTNIDFLFFLDYLTEI